MHSWKQQFFSFLGLSAIYLAVLAIFLPADFTKYAIGAVIVAFVLFSLSSLIMITRPEADGQTKIQRFMLGTTTQLLVSMFYLVIAKFTAPLHFKAVAFHYLVLFFAMLIVQVVLLVLRLRAVK